MRDFLVKCTRNTSQTLPYCEGETYQAKYEGKGLVKVFDEKGSFIQCPLNGFYLDFEEIK
jgi:hypothetical protein